MKKIIGTLIFIIGFTVIVYPTINDHFRDKKQDALINSFEEAMEILSKQNNMPLENIVVTTTEYADKVVVSLEEVKPIVVEETQIDPANLDVPESVAVTVEKIVYTREERNKYITSAWPVEAILTIEKIDLVMPIIEGTQAKYLDVSPCSVLGASKPWESGNYSIAGHRSLAYGRHFNRLNELAIDDVIVVTDLNGISYTYDVYQSTIVHETDTQVLLNNGYDEITLITCDPIGEKNPDYRLVVKAKKK